MSTPSPFTDEGWNASRAWGLLHTGRAYGSLDAGVFDHYDGYWTYFPWIGTALHAIPVFLFGPTLFSVRLVSLLFGVLLLTTVYIIGRILYDQRVGLVSVGLLALSVPFAAMSHLARHDIVVAALGFCAIALCLLRG